MTFWDGVIVTVIVGFVAAIIIVAWASSFRG